MLLGTGSADGWPNPFCRCASCDSARLGGAATARAHTSALVDGTLLLDAGPDVPLAASRHGVPLAGVTTVLLTHAHTDHVAPQLLLWRHWAGADSPLQLYGPPAALALFDDWVPPGAAVTRHPVAAGDVVDVDGFHVQALAAAHGDAVSGSTVVYDVTAADGSRLLYATDTGPFPAATLAATDGAAYDVVLLEETWGDRSAPAADHHDLRTFAATVAELRRRGAITERTRVAPVHLGHHNPPAAELAARLAAWDVELLADGTTITTGESRTPATRPGRTLVLGGARSGKSRTAERMLAAEPRVTYLATGVIDGDDDEWSARVATHRARRPASWETVESTDVAKVLAARTAADPPLLVDCLTLWLTAAMQDAGCWEPDAPAAAEARLAAAVEDLVAAWRGCRGRVVAVSNEVGQGVVPATPAGRRFRDEMGRVNAAVAAESDAVWLVTAGMLQRLR